MKGESFPVESRKDPAKSPPSQKPERNPGAGSYSLGSCGSCWWRRVRDQFGEKGVQLCTLMPAQQLVIPANLVGKKTQGQPELDPRSKTLIATEAVAAVINVQVTRAFPPIEDLEEEGCVMWHSWNTPPQGNLVPQAPRPAG